MCLLLGLWAEAPASYAPAVYSLASPIYDLSDLLAHALVLGVTVLNLWAAVLVIRVCRRWLRRTEPGAGAAGVAGSGPAPRGHAPSASPFSPVAWSGVGPAVVVPALVVGAIGVALTLLSLL